MQPPFHVHQALYKNNTIPPVCSRWCVQLNWFLAHELAEDGYSGVEVRVTPTRTEIIILATRTQNVLGEKGRRIRELTAVVQKRFNFPEGTVEVRTSSTCE